MKIAIVEDEKKWQHIVKRESALTVGNATAAAVINRFAEMFS